MQHGDGAFDKLLVQLTRQHQQFLEQAAAAAFQTLASDNKRLNAEVAELRAVLREACEASASPLRARGRRTTWNGSRLNKLSFLARTTSEPLKSPDEKAGQLGLCSGGSCGSGSAEEDFSATETVAADGSDFALATTASATATATASLSAGKISGAVNEQQWQQLDAASLRPSPPVLPSAVVSPITSPVSLRQAAASPQPPSPSKRRRNSNASVGAVGSAVGRGMLAGLRRYRLITNSAPAPQLQLQLQLPAQPNESPGAAALRSAATVATGASTIDSAAGEPRESSSSPSPSQGPSQGPVIPARRNSALSSYSSGVKQRLTGSAPRPSPVAALAAGGVAAAGTVAATEAAAGAGAGAAASLAAEQQSVREGEARLPTREVSPSRRAHFVVPASSSSMDPSKSPPAAADTSKTTGAGVLHPAPPLPCAPMSPVTTSLNLEDTDFPSELMGPTRSPIDEDVADLKEMLRLSDEDCESPQLPKELWTSLEVQEATVSVGTTSPWSHNSPDGDNNRKNMVSVVSRTLGRKTSKGIGNWFRVNSDLDRTQKELARSIDTCVSSSQKAHETTMGSDEIRASIIGAFQSRSPERKARKPTWNLGGFNFTMTHGGMFGKQIRRSPTTAVVEPLEPMIQRRSSSMANNGSVVVPLNDARRIKEHKRLKHLLRMDEANDKSFDECSVNGETLFYCLRDRELGSEVSVEMTDIAIHVFEALSKGLFPEMSCQEPGRVSIAALVSILWLQNLEDHVSKEYLEAANQVILALRTPTSEEIVHEAARCTYYEKAVVHTTHDFGWYLKNTVSAVVILNMIAIGLSVDNEPNHPAWLAFEVFCTSVFVFEVVYFWCHQGARHYLRGESGYWNTMDVMITALALFQVTFEIILRLNLDVGILTDIHEATSAAVMLRGLRAVRVVRLVKLVKSPLLRDLASMLVGFVIGIPSLIWVLAMFVFILCLFGLFFRLMFGPSSSRPTNYYHDLCGSGDDLSDLESIECPIHYVYGEEFFGTVGKSMFTCFRFMLGDYDTRNGKSLVVTFSFLYGTKFDIVFVAWMIVVIFGIFNIITAIFVDTTVAGLKHNDVKRKHAQQYERAYVKRKLTVLLDRIQTIAAARDDLHQTKEGQLGQQIELDEEQFVEIVDDSTVKGVLSDLDVEVFNLRNMFTTFDGDDSGKVTLQELVEGIVKLRGEPQKSDVIGCWVSTRSLHEKIDALRGIVDAKCSNERLDGAAAMPVAGPESEEPQQSSGSDLLILPQSSEQGDE